MFSRSQIRICALIHISALSRLSVIAHLMRVSAQDPNRFRAALITGASSGIGAALAALLPPPTRLLLSGRDVAALERVRDGLPEPGRVAIVVADLTRAADRDRIAAAGDA